MAERVSLEAYTSASDAVHHYQLYIRPHCFQGVNQPMLEPIRRLAERHHPGAFWNVL